MPDYTVWDENYLAELVDLGTAVGQQQIHKRSLHPQQPKGRSASAMDYLLLACLTAFCLAGMYFLGSTIATALEGLLG